MKTLAQKERRRRYLKKHPDVYIKQLQKWIAKETDPARLTLAKNILKFKQQPCQISKKKKKSQQVSTAKNAQTRVLINR